MGEHGIFASSLLKRNASRSKTIQSDTPEGVQSGEGYLLYSRNAMSDVGTRALRNAARRLSPMSSSSAREVTASKPPELIRSGGGRRGGNAPPGAWWQYQMHQHYRLRSA